MPIPKGVRGEYNLLYMKNLSFIAIVALLMLACSDKNEPKNPGDSTTISCNTTKKLVKKTGDEFSVNLKSETEWFAVVDKPWVKVTPESAEGNTVVRVEVAAGYRDKALVVFTNADNITSLTIYRDSIEGALFSEFSINKSDKIQFSQGNLQYKAITDKWCFAENQYDMIGSDNSNISSVYTGLIDLFGWGTANTPTLHSKDPEDYDKFDDWGTKSISNGGGKSENWRTLTKDEWTYLIESRSNADKLSGLGTVNGVNGIIILPDSWQYAEDSIFVAGADKGYKQNTYSLEEWRLMEYAGAVFMPAVGHRNDTDLYNVGTCGNYWSSTPSHMPEAYFLRFDESSIDPAHKYLRFRGRSVRLVRDMN